MYYDIQSFHHLGGHEIMVTFADGMSGKVRFSADFFCGVFAPLHDEELFRTVCLDDGALSWPGQADIAPDALHQAILTHGEAFLQ